MVFETSPDVFLEAPLEVLRRLLSELQAGVLTGGGATFKRLLESGYAFWGRCFLVLLLGSLKGALVGVRWCDEQSERRPDWGSDEGEFLSQSAFSKWNMRKVPIFRVWKSPVLPRNSAVLGRKWSLSATIHPESDYSHI